MEGFICVQAPTADEIIEELASLDIFEYEVSEKALRQGRGASGERVGDLQFAVGFPDIVETHYVGVFNELHNDDFALNTEEHLVILIKQAEIVGLSDLCVLCWPRTFLSASLRDMRLLSNACLGTILTAAS